MISAPSHKTWISELYPKYDDLFGALPPDRQVTVEEILRPTLIRVTDKHSGTSNSHVDKIYELERHVIPQGAIDKGDDPDLQSLGSGDPSSFLSIEHVVLLDQRNHLRDRHRIISIKHRGNHDLTTALASEEEIHSVGLHIYPAVRTEHPDQRRIVDIHGHEPESAYMVTVPTKIASGVHDKLARKGQDAAATAKNITKITTGAVGLDHSLRYMSYMYDANIYTGHTHRVRRTTLDYKKKINRPTLDRELQDRLMTTFFSSVLWLHRTGTLENIINKIAIPELKKSYGEGRVAFDGKAMIQELFKHTTNQVVKTMRCEFSPEDLRVLKDVRKNIFMGMALLLEQSGLSDVAIEKLLTPGIMKLIATKLGTEADPDGQIKMAEVHRRAGEQFLHVLEEDPKVALFEGMTLTKMRPRFYGKTIPAKTPSGYKTAEISTPGCFLDGRATYAATFADTGQTYILDWTKVREFTRSSLANMPEQPLAGNDLIVDHFRTYDGLHPDTIRQLEFYHKYQGTFSDEDTEMYSRPPKLEEMPVIKMSRIGIESVTLPDGRPLILPKATEAHEFVPSHAVLTILQKINVFSAMDLECRMESDFRMKDLFEPAKGLPHPQRPIFEEWQIPQGQFGPDVLVAV